MAQMNAEPVADYVQELMTECRAEARKQGYDGTDREFTYTHFDMQWIAEQVEQRYGRKPTLAEWERYCNIYLWDAHQDYTCDAGADWRRRAQKRTEL